MELLEYLRLSLRRSAKLSPAQRQRLDELARKDVEMGDRIVVWGIPALLGLGLLLLLVFGLWFNG